MGTIKVEFIGNEGAQTTLENVSRVELGFAVTQVMHKLSVHSKRNPVQVLNEFMQKAVEEEGFLDKFEGTGLFEIVFDEDSVTTNIDELTVGQLCIVHTVLFERFNEVSEEVEDDETDDLWQVLEALVERLAKSGKSL